jgi:hypothetical protein
VRFGQKIQEIPKNRTIPKNQKIFLGASIGALFIKGYLFIPSLPSRLAVGRAFGVGATVSGGSIFRLMVSFASIPICKDWLKPIITAQAPLA